jgi:DNA topoisomerase I
VFLAMRDAERTSLTSSRRAVSGAVKDVASYLGNTPAVARASYIDPRLVERFEQGITIAPTLERLKTDDPTDPVFREAVEAAVLELLEEPEATAKAA